jgi:electron transport complex protein RnfG
MIDKQVIRAGALLTAFAVGGAALVAISFHVTAEQIVENRRAVLMRNLSTLIPADLYDNDLLTDTIDVPGDDLLGGEEPVSVYRARKNGEPVALAFMPTAPDGYSGNIKLLVGIKYDGSLTGVRVVEHHETPGLGDAIEAERSDWILSFAGKSLDNPETAQWAVKRDGGVFDQFTGATITPRAVVKAVRRSLEFYNAEREHLFAVDFQAKH